MERTECVSSVTFVSSRDWGRLFERFSCLRSSSKSRIMNLLHYCSASISNYSYFYILFHCPQEKIYYRYILFYFFCTFRLFVEMFGESFWKLVRDFCQPRRILCKLNIFLNYSTHVITLRLKC